MGVGLCDAACCWSPYCSPHLLQDAAAAAAGEKAEAGDLKMPPFNGPQGQQGVQPPTNSSLLNYKEDDLLF